MSSIVIAVGNRMRGDDAAGPIVLDRLRLRGHEEGLVECAGDVSDLIEAWRGADRAIVVDAVVSGAAAGTLHEVDGRCGIPAGWRSPSTHLIGLAEAIDLAAALDAMPQQLTIYGIEAAAAEPGTALSPAVEAAVDAVVARILETARA